MKIGWSFVPRKSLAKGAHGVPRNELGQAQHKHWGENAFPRPFY